MVQLRRTLSLVVCFSVCLIGCVSPAYANLSQTFDYVNGGFFYPSAVSPFNFVIGGQNVSPFSGYMSASFDSSSIDGSSWLFVGDEIPGLTSQLKIVDGTYLEILFNVTSAQSITVSSPASSNYASFTVGYTPNSYGNPNLYSPKYSSVEFIYDSSEVPCTLTGTQIYIPDGTYKVARYFGFRFNFLASTFYPDADNIALCMKLFSNASFSAEDWPAGDVIGSIDMNTGVLQEIAGDVSDIKTQLTQLNQDILDIKDTVSDTHDQLENPDSNIWQAAGSAISGAIESLFVPSEQDIANVKQGFDDLAQDKLGGAYTAMETVEDTITQVNDKLNNPSAAEGVEFPGIAVPLGGEVGTVVLAERQMVTLPMELTAILHPLGGTIISIIAGLGTFNVLKDMVECFLSGFSYAEYLHRNKGGSDE